MKLQSMPNYFKLAISDMRRLESRNKVKQLIDSNIELNSAAARLTRWKKDDKIRRRVDSEFGRNF